MARTSKPNALGVMPLPQRIGGRCSVGYGVTLAFPLQESGVLLAETDLWQLLAPYLPVIMTLDTGAPKVRGEWMLAGSTYAPQGAMKTWEAEVCLGASRKRLRVHGPRFWQQEQLGPAEPVRSVAMGWQSTWGGPQVAENKAGCGGRGESEDVTVPCIELPDHPWRHPDELCRPASTLPHDSWHPRRRACVGTYGADYLERFFPGMPPDFDPRFFNLAPEDQQIDGVWRGDEPFVLRHWHPDLPCIEGTLPRLRVALHVGRVGQDGLERVETSLTTVWFFPEVGVGVLVFHGSVACKNLDGSDVDRVIAGVERLCEAPRPVAHYEALWARRTARTVEAAAFALEDSSLLPQGYVTRFTTLDEALSRLRPNPTFEKMGERMARSWDEAADRLQQLMDQAQASVKTAFSDKLSSLGSPVPQSEPAQAVVGAFQQQGPGRATEVVEGLKKSFGEMAEICRRTPVFDPRKTKAHDAFGEADRFRRDLTQSLQAMAGRYKVFKPTPQEQELFDQCAEKWPQMRQWMGEAAPEQSPLDSIKAAQQPFSPPAFDAGDLKEASALLKPQYICDSVTSLKAMVANLAAGQSPQAPQDANLRRVEALEQMIIERGDDLASGAQNLVEEVQAWAAMAAQLPPLPPPPPPEGDWDAYGKELVAQAKPIQFTPLVDADLKPPDLSWRPGVRLANRTLGQRRMRDLDLRGSHFEGVTFICCDFRGCDLSDTIWTKCILINCDLTGARMQGAKIDDLGLQWSCLDDLQACASHWSRLRWMFGTARRADWSRSRWETGFVLLADFSDTDWQVAEIVRVIVHETEHGHARFDRVQAEQSMWNQCMLAHSVWDSAKVTRCNFNESQLPIQWQEASLTHVCMHGASLIAGRWQKARLEGVDLTRAVLRDSDFSEMQAHSLYLQQADLRGVDFSNAQVEQGLFTGADLRASCFVGARLRHCWLGLCHLDDQTDFAGAELLSANFHPRREAEDL